VTGIPAPAAYTVGTVISRDGTTIGYRQFGHGPGIVLVHGGMQAAQNFGKLASALADAFAVYVPDRRGRGVSGPPGERYCLTTECEDLDALLAATGTHNVFGLSSGALIALEAARTLPAIHKVALYEPPLSVDHSTPTDWVARYDREIAEGKLGSAVFTALKGTQSAPPFIRFVPRVLLDPVLNRATRVGGEVGSGRDDRPPPVRSRARGAAMRALLWPLRRAARRNERSDDGVGRPADVPLRALVPTMHYDAQLVIESEGTLPQYAGVPAEVLLLGGSQSPRYLRQSLDALSGVLPHARRVELAGVGHLAADNSEKLELVARELRGFFTSDVTP
jgi:pimeloyl-ACP methyl ester carboxylesterase